MTTVYAVNEGTYSDYRVTALFSTLELAQAFMAAVPGEYNPVETYLLDPETAPQLREGYRPWVVYLLRDGSIERADARDVSTYTVQESSDLWCRSLAPAYAGRKLRDCLVWSGLARTEEHAAKIANERRLQLIANGEWKEPA